jgi:hypothetical protein
MISTGEPYAHNEARAMTAPHAADHRSPTVQGLPWRLLPWVALILGWLYMLLRMWSAFATFPSAERLEQARLVAIPTLGTLALLGLRSSVELAAVLALTWPWSARLWILRVWSAALIVAIYFVATAPLGISAVTWVHRRWLVGMAAGLAVIATAALIARLTRFLASRLFPR